MICQGCNHPEESAVHQMTCILPEVERVEADAIRIVREEHGRYRSALIDILAACDQAFGREYLDSDKGKGLAQFIYNVANKAIHQPDVI